MDESETNIGAAEIERRLLRAVCSPLVDGDTRTKILNRLARHRFENPDHETIFRVLNQIPRASAEHIRQTLGARVTRLGFPDIEVEWIFEFEAPSSNEIQILLERLDR
ncbi:MAG TPA: hypothetical protein VKW78_00070 [Terriglobales bacterium]|nr:hypothetical protein [Terriglobales bacterium]